MNAQEIMSKVFELVGEPEDLRPYATPGDPLTFDINLTGAVRLLSWVNQAVVRIANWSFPDGAILRARSLLKKMYFQNKAALTGTALSATADSLTWIGLTPLNTVNQFNGWLITTTGGIGEGQTREIIACVGANAANCVMTVHKTWDVTPDATTTFKLYKRMFKLLPVVVVGSVSDYHIYLDPISNISDVLKITDIEGSTDLSIVDYNDVLTGTRISNSPPSSFARLGDEIWFDSAYDTARSYELTYYKHPTLLALATDVPELPVPFHEAIVEWAVHTLLMRSQDFTGAYATKRDLQDLMQTLRMQGRLEGMYERGGVTVFEG
jgi:hypothetical protein